VLAEPFRSERFSIISVAASNAPSAASGVAAHSINGDQILGNGLAAPFWSGLPSAA
jgi:hypothetical protein